MTERKYCGRQGIRSSREVGVDEHGQYLEELTLACGHTAIRRTSSTSSLVQCMEPIPPDPLLQVARARVMAFLLGQKARRTSDVVDDIVSARLPRPTVLRAIADLVNEGVLDRQTAQGPISIRS